MASKEIERHNETLLDELEGGDLVEFPRGIWSHWAVYVGDGHVVHLAGEDNDGLSAYVDSTSSSSISGPQFNKACVRRDRFHKVAGQSKAKKNNSKDRRSPPKSRDKIVETALSTTGETGYSVLWNNCEHFASLCRYGDKISEQVENLIGIGVVVVTGVVAVFALGLGIASKVLKSKNE